MLPKSLLITMFFAVRIDRSFEVSNVITTKTDGETLEQVPKINVKNQFGMLPILVTHEDDETGVQNVLDFFDRQISGINILRVIVGHHSNTVTNKYLQHIKHGNAPKYPYVAALNNNKLIYTLVRGYDDGLLKLLYGDAISPNPKYFTPNCRSFTADLRDRINQNEEQKIKWNESYKAKREGKAKKEVTGHIVTPKTQQERTPTSPLSIPNVANNMWIGLDLTREGVYRKSSENAQKADKNSSSISFDPVITKRKKT